MVFLFQLNKVESVFSEWPTDRHLLFLFDLRVSCWNVLDPLEIQSRCAEFRATTKAIAYMYHKQPSQVNWNVLNSVQIFCQ